MNLVLLDSEDTKVIFSDSDPRAKHILHVLHRQVGDTLDVGSEAGSVGKGTVRQITKDEVTLSVRWTGVAPELHPITLILGMPRPQTARRLLRETTALGVRHLAFCGTDRGEPGYAASKLWTSMEWKRHLRAGVEQAFNPRLPTLSMHADLASAVDEMDPNSDLIAMDNYESPDRLSNWGPGQDALVIALGAERGWSPRERDLFRENDFSFYHLGTRVLRLDTAAIASVAIALSRMGLA